MANGTYTPAAARGGHDRLIEPAVLARLNNLELVARTAVEGALIGLHRSPSFGFSQEFAEYRGYMPGDDPRDIDWNVYARTDRTYVKRYYGDTNCRLMVLLDSSASMASLAEDAVGKLDYARFFAAALVYLAHRQHDAVGLLAFNDRVHHFRPPTGRGASVRALYHELDQLEADGGSDWTLPLKQVQGQFRKAGLIVLISDFYTDPDELATVLRGLSANGHDLLLVHILDPAEETPALAGATTLRDAETGEVMEVTGEELKTEYPARLAAHSNRLKQLTLGMGGHYLKVVTHEPLDRVLAGYLHFRARHP
ncbi:MAG: DUF58 domain-containing protein [Pseudomonadota bacterium]